MTMICHDGKVALQSFAPTVLLFAAIFLLPINANNLLHYEYNQFVNPLLYYSIVNITLFIVYEKLDYQIAIRAALLAQIFVLGLYVFAYCPQHVYIFGIYMSVISFFHYSEYVTLALIKVKELGTATFMLTHSPAYVAAAICSWLEFALESYFLPSMKMFPYLPYIGLVVCLLGECLRKVAMFTASKNFDHKVRFTKTDDHILITHGIYNWCRHPSYVGWFYWSIGTQLILINPICVILYTGISWAFFKERIYFEEITLLNFFGIEYCNYQQRVGTGLPFIKGYIVRP